MKVIIEKEVNYCEDCPYSKTEKVYTPDPFENCRKVFCQKLNKMIHSCLDWNEKSKIPNECTFK